MRAGRCAILRVHHRKDPRDEERRADDLVVKGPACVEYSLGVSFATRERYEYEYTR